MLFTVATLSGLEGIKNLLYRWLGSLNNRSWTNLFSKINITIIKTKGFDVNKSELVEAMAAAADISKAAAERALDGATAAITGALKGGDQVTIVGFGSFLVGERGARMGRNPRTGESIQIKASKSPKFRAGKALKDAVN